MEVETRSYKSRKDGCSAELWQDGFQLEPHVSFHLTPGNCRLKSKETRDAPKYYFSEIKMKEQKTLPPAPGLPV